MAYSLFDILKNQGRNGDTELAHITPGEANLLKALGGSGTTNPNTGLKEYHGSLTGYGGLPAGDPAHHWTLQDNPITDVLYGDGDNPNPYTQLMSELLFEPNPDAIAGWDEYKDLDPGQFIDYDDEQRLLLAENLADMDISADDLAKYMPVYDERGEQNIRAERDFARTQQGQEISDIGRSKQSELLTMAQDKFSTMRTGGFASTGNPMIDRQRQGIYSDISSETSKAWGQMQEDERLFSEDIYSYQEDFMQKFGERLIEYEDRREKD